MSWVRGHRVPVALVSVLVVGLAVVTGVLLSGAKSSNSPVGTAAAKAQGASTVTKGSKWLADARPLTVVNADLGKVLAAQHAGNRAAARTAGARLAADAGTALGGAMPPLDAAVYRSALQDLKAAGVDVAGGQSGQKAAQLLRAGEAGLMKVTAAADTAVPVKTPPIPEQPAGQ
jgi:hypothetical protein